MSGGANLTVLSAAGTLSNLFFLSCSEKFILLMFVLIPNKSPEPLTSEIIFYELYNFFKLR